MKPDSITKRKATSGKRLGLRRWIVDWTIEPVAASGHISLSLYVAGESDDNVGSSTTRHFLLRQDRLSELIDALNGTLQHSNASRLLEEQARAADPAVGHDADTAGGVCRKGSAGFDVEPLLTRRLWPRG
ncbi:hypothetical protein [Paraburkholderia youngii]|uniref:hypothetical protein n=1 Tax=Paraburkholderia youngii TaxID=2782701 RepID=UPI003D1B4D8A